MSSPARELTSEIGASAEETLRWAYETYPDVVIVASFQAESSVIIDIASRIRPGAHVLTLDTGRLPQETYDVIDRMRERYDIRLDVVSPDAEETRAMVAQHGVNLFYGSVAMRNACCEVRKARPLERALRGRSAWITGLRRDQARTRSETPVAAPDPLHGGIMKIAPLARWTRGDVWDHIRSNDVPYHDLYDRGYTSIGCEPCTRAIRPGEGERAGRWWWEDSDVKECSIHWPLERRGASA
ncbi:MAG TPA: phosphoadenylyl-sulfate reductase [Candidatus Dormibacteraeota bacterium]|nr:phosphoadenylyl-sulfate reductase [Candidatus Dormibacteraeota bacterium]